MRYGNKVTDAQYIGKAIGHHDVKASATINGGSVAEIDAERRENIEAESLCDTQCALVRNLLGEHVMKGSLVEADKAAFDAGRPVSAEQIIGEREVNADEQLVARNTVNGH